MFGQLAPTILFLPRYRGCFSVSNFRKIGKIAVSPSMSSDSELAPYKSALLRCFRCFSGATFGDEWWCECCTDLTNLRCGVVEWIFSRSRSLSVSLWPSGIFGLWRCLVRFFSDTLRCIGGAIVGGVFWSYGPRWECSCWQRCGLPWWRDGDCRCLACERVCVSHRSLCDTTKLLLSALPMLTRRCGSCGISVARNKFKNQSGSGWDEDVSLTFDAAFVWTKVIQFTIRIVQRRRWIQLWTIAGGFLLKLLQF